MSKEKQIIGIKECIDAVYGADCAYYDVDGFAIANEIYNAGYRKQKEVAREIFEEMQSCLTERHWDGLDIVSFEFDAVKYAELKKKYT